jgi:outer membrane lipoprotein-sorting protein
MRFNSKLLYVVVFSFFICFSFVPAYAMTADEILQQLEKQNFNDNFRVVLSSKTLKGKKTISENVIWLMGVKLGDKNAFFLDFEQPKESEGLRFLILVDGNKSAQAYMYLPATGKTLPLAMDDPAADLGGTGLSIEDIQGFIPKGDEKASILKEEQVDGRDCYVIRVEQPSDSSERQLWITKKDFLLLKTQAVDQSGKIKRTFRVTEMFVTEQGREFPRAEEISIPEKDTRIQIRQENAVFGIQIPEEISDPAKFGTFRWKS